MSQRSEHLTPSELHDLVEGTIVAAGIDEHLRECAVCGESLAAYREADRKLTDFLTSRAETGPGDGDPCPDALEWSRAAETPDSPDVARLLEHAAYCSRCSVAAALLTESYQAVPPPELHSDSHAWQVEMARRLIAKAEPKQRRGYLLPVIAAAAVVSALAVGWTLRHADSNADVLIARAYTEQRPFEFRLPDHGHSRVAKIKGSGSLFGLPPSLKKAAALIEEDAAETPVNIRRKAEVELFEGAYESSISALEKLYRSDPADSTVWLPLAAAYFERVEAHASSQPADYARALDLIYKLKQKQPGNPLVVFDLALIYERTYSFDAAIRTWEEFLKLDPQSGYAAEARKHLEELSGRRASRERILDAVQPDPTKYLALRSEDRFSRELFLEVALSEWLPRAAAKTSERSALNRLALEFQAQAHDPMLVEIATAKITPLTFLANAIRLDHSADPAEGGKFATQGLTNLRDNRAALLRARFEKVYAAHRSGETRACFADSKRLDAEPGLAKYPWIRVQNKIELSVCQAQLGNLSDALETISTAVSLAHSARLPISELRAKTMLADFLEKVGDRPAYWRIVAANLEIFWREPAPPNQAHQLFFSLRDAAAAERLPHAAFVFSRTATDFIQRTGESLLIAHGWDTTAALARGIGDTAEETRMATLSRLAFDRASPSDLKRIYAANNALFRAKADLDGNTSPKETARRLEDLSDSYLVTDVAKAQRDDLLATAYWRGGLSQRAEMKALDIVARAERIWHKDGQRPQAVGILASLQLAGKRDPDSAFRTWQRLSEPVENRQLTEETYVSFADLPDGPVVWLLDNRGLFVARLDTTATALDKTIQSWIDACSRPDSDQASLSRTSEWLRHVLVAPIERRLEPHRTIVVEVPGQWSGVPFTLLMPKGIGPVVRSLSLRDYMSRRNAEVVKRSHRLVMFAAPDVSRELLSLYPPLPDVRLEMAAIAGSFAHSIHRTGAAATASQLSEAAQSAEVFHFTGHGSRNSGSGALLLAPESSGRPYSGLVTAETIAGQDWSRCRLAVLSACATAPEGGNFIGDSLVHAFLSAGAKRVVASLWSVDATATAALMSEFYRLMVEGRPPGESLQLAALSIRKQPGMEHPYFWAGFEMFGYR